jgi:pyruvate kinase
VTDVYNAVLDGTDAVMLSAETAVGKHPFAAVEVMGRIAERAEAVLLAEGIEQRRHAVATPDVADAVAHSAARAAEELDASAIIALTHHGLSARMLSKYKPAVPIYAVTSRPETYQRLGLLWGVTPVLSRFQEDEWDALGAARDALLATGRYTPKDIVVVLSSRSGVRSPSNTLRVGALKEMGPR